MKSLSIWIAGIAIGVTMVANVGCNDNSIPTVPEIDEGETIWELQSIETAAGVVSVPDPARYTLELRDDGTAHVRADCNVCNGPYELEGTSLTFGLMACTLAACPPDSLHDDYVRALGSVSMWQRPGDELVLTYEDGTLTFR